MKIYSPSFLASVALCLAAPRTRFQSASAFRPDVIFPAIAASRSRSRAPVRRETATTTSSSSRLDMAPEFSDSILLPISTGVPMSAATTTSIVLSEESWRQYVPLVVSCLVIVDILLGSPIANLALGPMRRASEKGATGDSARGDDDGGGNDSGGGGSLFSSVPGIGGISDSARGKERVDSEAIAQAALDKAMNTLELKRFLEENKTDEQRYEDVRKKIDRQMSELED